VSGKLLLVFQSLHKDGWARVGVRGTESSQFEVKKGVRQGYPCGSLMLYRSNIDRSKEAFLWNCTVSHRKVRGMIACL